MHNPPPGTTPISMALLTEFKASSYRNFLSFNSVSVAAPTLIRAIPLFMGERSHHCMETRKRRDEGEEDG